MMINAGLFISLISLLQLRLVNNTVWHITCQHMFGFFNVTFKKIKDVSSTTPDKYPTIFTVCCFSFRYERVNVQTVKSEMTTREQNTHHL